MSKEQTTVAASGNKMQHVNIKDVDATQSKQVEPSFKSGLDDWLGVFREDILKLAPEAGLTDALEIVSKHILDAHNRELNKLRHMYKALQENMNKTPRMLEVTTRVAVVAALEELKAEMHADDAEILRMSGMKKFPENYHTYDVLFDQAIAKAEKGKL